MSVQEFQVGDLVACKVLEGEWKVAAIYEATLRLEQHLAIHFRPKDACTLIEGVPHE